MSATVSAHAITRITSAFSMAASSSSASRSLTIRPPRFL